MSKRCRLGAEAARAGIMGRVFVIREQIEPVRTEEVDGIHDMRVASRRLRAALSDFGGLLPETPGKVFRAYARDITKLLGEPREVDVLIEMMARRRKSAEGAARTAYSYALRRARARRKDLTGACQEALRLVEAADFEQHAQAVIDGLGTASKCYVKQARRSLVRRFQDLCKEYDHWRKTGEEERLHRLRVVFKKFRYACELYAPLYGDRFNAFIKRLKETQDVLGDWNDCRTLRNELAAIAKDAPPKSASGFPKIVADMKRRSRDQQAEFERQAKRFFSGARRKAVEELLRHPVQPCCAPKAEASAEAGEADAVRVPA